PTMHYSPTPRWLRLRWFRLGRHFDGLFLLAERQRAGLRQLLRRWTAVAARRRVRVSPQLETLDPRRLFAASILATGPDAGRPPVVHVLDAHTRSEVFSVEPYADSFRGG